MTEQEIKKPDLDNPYAKCIIKRIDDGILVSLWMLPRMEAFVSRLSSPTVITVAGKRINTHCQIDYLPLPGNYDAQLQNIIAVKGTSVDTGVTIIFPVSRSRDQLKLAKEGIYYTLTQLFEDTSPIVHEIILCGMR